MTDMSVSDVAYVDEQAGNWIAGRPVVVDEHDVQPAQPPDQPPEPLRLTLPVIDGNPRRVLIVDDNADAADTMAAVLNEFGCETRVAYDGPSALALVEHFKPQFALLDIGLPVMNGYELARRLREFPQTSTIRLIAVTGYGQKRDIDLAFAAGFDRHLMKPVQIEKLEAMLLETPHSIDLRPGQS